MQRKGNLKTDLVFDLINAFKSIKSAKESALFLQDILTAREIKNLSIRLRIAKLLLKGVTHRDISFQLKVAVATVSKVSSWLNSKGEGFKQIIYRLPNLVEEPTPIHGPLEFHLPEVIAKSVQYGVSRHQKKPVENLIKETKDKRYLDKQTKEFYSDYYKYKFKKK